jgi:hypothetical protein
MKDLIKELLDELIPRITPTEKHKHLKKAFQIKNRIDAIVTANVLLDWQKGIQNERIPLFEPNTKDQLVLEDVEIPRFKDFFEKGEALNAIFVLNSDKVTYNKDLSPEEIQEILEYIDENYKITRRAGNRRRII